MTDLSLLDTNILVYAYDTSEGKKHSIAKQMVEDVFMGFDAVVSVQNLAEFYSIITTKIKNRLSKEQAKEILRTIINFKHFKKIKYDEKTLINATQMEMPFWDALIASTMLMNNIYTIYTENTKDFKDSRIKAINPFKR